MRILLDTNIIIHREAARVINKDIGILYNWIERLKYEKYIHPATVKELRKHNDPKIVKSMEIKIKSYNALKTVSRDDDRITETRRKFDKTENDKPDTDILRELYNERVDLLISEDRLIHKKANYLNIADKVYTIESFLEKVTAENPELTDYNVLSVSKEYFGNINIDDDFFDTFKEDYPGFEKWFNRKSDEIAYICKSDNNSILAFLYLKIENESENYSDITPKFEKKKRLKIGTFKVVLNGYKLGERFLKIIFDNALANKVDEIYVTIFPKRTGQILLIKLLTDWGFSFYGKKDSFGDDERVYVRKFSPAFNLNSPQKTYPYISRKRPVYIVPIYPKYHTDLFPDSMLNNESPANFVENEPYRNAIKKVYISRSYNRDIKKGDIIVFYRTKYKGSAYYTSVVTTIGIADEVITDITREEHFVSLCRKRSVFSDKELKNHWNYSSNKPFIVNFFYIFSFPMPRPNLKLLKEFNIIAEAPRGFEPMSKTSFNTLLKETETDERFIID
jgi:predicted nucleic acid-binding protein